MKTHTRTTVIPSIMLLMAAMLFACQRNDPIGPLGSTASLAKGGNGGGKPSTTLETIYLSAAQTGGPQVASILEDGTDFKWTNAFPDGGQFDVSPDGKTAVLANQNSDYTWDLFLQNMKTRNATRLTNVHAGGITSPRWSPDGQQILMSMVVGGTWDLRVVDLAGNVSLSNYQSVGPNLYSSWTPQGGYAFVHMENYQGSVLQSLMVTRLTDGLVGTYSCAQVPGSTIEASCFDPTVSASGDVVFGWCPGIQPNDPACGLYHWNVADPDLSTATPLGIKGKQPRYSPDGTRLAYIGGGLATTLVLYEPGNPLKPPTVLIASSGQNPILGLSWRF